MSEVFPSAKRSDKIILLILSDKFFCRHPIDALGFAPSQVRKAIPGTLLGHILKNGIEMAH